MKGIMRVVILCVLCCINVCGFSSTAVVENVRKLDLNLLRCEAKCWRRKSEDKEACLNVCLSEDYDNPGHCPDAVTSSFASACIVACDKDMECPATHKCCRHSCGVTCQQAQSLEQVIGLPTVPTNITVTEKRRGRLVNISWLCHTKPVGDVLYLLEERHNIGRHYTSVRVTEWESFHKTHEHHALLKNHLRPGHWYEFRVAAVNRNGTKGFSEPSKPFTLPVTPRPPGQPQNLAVGPVYWDNGSLQAEVHWDPPAQSDLPVQRYKIFWSIRLQGAGSSVTSVLVQHQLVPKDATTFLIRELQPSSLYFIQVQAFSQFGRERLKGEKAAIVLNTTHHENVADIGSQMAADDSIHAGRIDGLQLDHVYWSRDQLMAHVSWTSLDNSTKRSYTVTWWSRACETKGSGSRVQALTDEPNYDLYGLKFNCKYWVTVRDSSVMAHPDQEAKLMFVTPTLEEIKNETEEGVPCNKTKLSNMYVTSNVEEFHQYDETKFGEDAASIASSYASAITSLSLSSLMFVFVEIIQIFQR